VQLPGEDVVRLVNLLREAAAALAVVRVPQRQEEKDDDVTRSGRLAVPPAPQPAATKGEG